MKRFIILILTALIAAASVVTAFADETANNFGRVNINMPELTVELKDTDLDDASEIEAYLGDSKLTVDDAHTYDQSQDTSRVYMLVDISATMNRYRNQVREFIKSYASRMGEKDALALVTVGNEVKVVLDETNDASKIAEKVDALKFDEDYTHLCDALDTVYNKAAVTMNDYTRSYVLAFTDCDDDTKTGVTVQEIADKYKSHQLPLFISAPYNNEKFSKIARESGGGLQVIENLDEFDTFTNTIDEVSILKLKADNNNASGEQKNLQIKSGDKSYNINVTVSNSIADNEAPSIKSLSFDEQNNRFVLTFSEKVTDASSKGAYSVTDENGKKWTVKSAEAQTEADSVQLVMEDSITNGVYTVTVEGLTDVSKQKNPLSEKSKSVEVSGIVPPPQEPMNDGFGFPLLIIVIAGAVLVAAAIIVIVIVLASRNRQTVDDSIPEIVPPAVNAERPGQEIVNEYGGNPTTARHHIKNENTIKLQLRVKTGNASEQVINTEVSSSVIVGRSSVCEIFIDDAKLSRQHFVLENINQELYISDLSSKNGTFVNGVKIESRRKIMNRDRIPFGDDGHDNGVGEINNVTV